MDEEMARRSTVDPRDTVALLPLGADDAAEEVGDDVQGKEGVAVPAELGLCGIGGCIMISFVLFRTAIDQFVKR